MIEARTPRRARGIILLAIAAAMMAGRAPIAAANPPLVDHDRLANALAAARVAVWEAASWAASAVACGARDEDWFETADDALDDAAQIAARKIWPPGTDWTWTDDASLAVGHAALKVVAAAETEGRALAPARCAAMKGSPALRRVDQIIAESRRRMAAEWREICKQGGLIAIDGTRAKCDDADQAASRNAR